MGPRELLRRVGYYLTVPRCVCCHERLAPQELALCTGCLAQYRAYLTRDCSRCAQVLSRCSCSNRYLETHGIRSLHKVFRYRHTEQAAPANALIYSLKREDRRDVLAFLIGELADALEASGRELSEYVFTYIPRRRSSVVAYGMDHAALLARELARHFHATFAHTLVSRARRAQKSLQRDERMRNVAMDYRRGVDLTGRRVVLIDDIVTTGASMGCGAMLLRGLGAREVVGAVLAVTYRDGQTLLPFDGQR